MKIEVLDHGYVEYIESWGEGGLCEGDSERGIIEAARQSTQGSFRGWKKGTCDCGLIGENGTHEDFCASIKNPGDAKLLEFLYENKHETPFEFAGMVIEVQAPIFVFREWHRHRTQSYNEMPARYSPLPDLYYLPDAGILEARKSGRPPVNRQSGSMRPNEAAPDEEDQWLTELQNFYAVAESHYRSALAAGIPKELARLVMPVGHYSRMRASANLRNWLAFLTLRTDPKAQWEIRQFAQAVSEIVKGHFPHTWDLWASEKA